MLGALFKIVWQVAPQCFACRKLQPLIAMLSMLPRRVLAELRRLLGCQVRRLLQGPLALLLWRAKTMRRL
jgi:hypothetical protein